jgi:hypothetical protein
MTSKEGVAVWLCIIAIAVVVIYGLKTIGNIQREETQMNSCMDSVVIPDPESIDYDNQALEFTSQIRKCMRG